MIRLDLSRKNDVLYKFKFKFFVHKFSLFKGTHDKLSVFAGFYVTD